MTWLLWGALLLAQNASFTWVSRARNSGSLRYHAVASVFSNGVWFASMFFVVDILARVRESGSLALMLGAFAFYTACTVAGSVGMHHVLMRHVERGARRVGAA